MIEEFITSIVSSALVSGAVVWLSKAWIAERLKNAIKNEYDQKLESHKAQLKAANDIELEKLRSSLNILAAERQIEYSKLYEKRADAITEVYACLKDVYIQLHEYTKLFVPAGDSSIDERRARAADAYNKYIPVFHHKKIFIPEKTAKGIESLNQELLRVYTEFFYGVEHLPNGKEKTDNWREIFEKLNGPILNSLSDLENDFRLLLGEKENKKTETNV